MLKVGRRVRRNRGRRSESVVAFSPPPYRACPPAAALPRAGAARAAAASWARPGRRCRC